MIEDLRWVERIIFVPAVNDDDDNIYKTGPKILQAYDGHQWFDVPFVKLPEQKGNE